MSTSKKTTSKAAKSPAPATKPAAKPAAAKKATSSATVQTAAPLPAAVVRAAPTPAPAPTPSVKAVAPKPLVTTITARVDVGFGNALFIRGAGAGLSWEKGQPMECLAPDLWQIVLPESGRNVTFKFLVNDVTWCAGEDFSTAAGATSTFAPQF